MEETVGTSKTRSLFSQYRGLQTGQLTGTVNTRIGWSDIETGPLVKKSLLKESVSDSPELKARAIAPVTRRLEDVERITKLMGTPGGIRWATHVAEVESIQQELDRKLANHIADMHGEPGKPLNIESVLSNLGKGAVTAAGLAAETLGQVAVAGAGIHMTPYLRRSYLKQGSEGKKGIALILDHIGLSSNGDRSKVSQDRDRISRLLSDKEKNNLELGVQEERIGYEKVVASIPENSELTLKGEILMSYPNRIPISQVSGSTVKDFADRKGKLNVGFGLDRQYSSVSSYVNVSGSAVRFSGSRLQQEFNLNDSTVKQFSELGTNTDPNKFQDRTGLNTGFGLNVQYDSSSTYETTVNGLSVSDRVGGVKSESTTSHVIGKVHHNIKLRNKPSGYEDIVERNLEETAGWTYDKSHSPEFFNRMGLIPFEISTITPEKRFYMAFEANLKDFKDNYTGEWSDQQYVGRADKFYMYRGFEREITFSFSVVASQPKYLKPIYRKLNKLVAATAPTYREDGVFMRGTMTSITVGDYVVDLKGIFKSVNISWENDYPWEINIEGSTDLIRVPVVLDVAVNFTPVHDFISDHNTLGYFGNVL